MNFPYMNFDSLMDQAKCYAEDEGVPFDVAYPEWMRQNLEHLVRALKAPEAKLLKNPLGEIFYEFSYFLRDHALLVRERQQHPEIEREEVTRPVFIVGIHRTGTTYLHRLMSRDKRFWVLRLYELRGPVLRTGDYATVAGTPDDPRRERAEVAFRASGMLKAFEGIHDYDLDEACEDEPILRMVFSSWIYNFIFHMPDFDHWLTTSGSWNAYAFHRRVMQHFTWQRHQCQPESQRQWLLKMPFHLMELEALIKAYPDALFIQTHREPSQFVGSWISLVKQARSLCALPLPPHELGTKQLTSTSGMLDRAVDFRLAHPELEHRWVDVNYSDLVADPFGVVRRIYQHFGWTLEQESVDAMEEWQFRQAERRRNQTLHSYALEDYGLTSEVVNAAFARYRDFTRGIGCLVYD